MHHTPHFWQNWWCQYHSIQALQLKILFLSFFSLFIFPSSSYIMINCKFSTPKMTWFLSHHQMMKPTTPPSSQLKKKRNSNYQPKEDIEIFCAWVQVLEDPSIGTQKDQNNFWVQIANVYREAIPSPPGHLEVWSVAGRPYKKASTSSKCVSTRSRNSTRVVCHPKTS